MLVVTAVEATALDFRDDIVGELAQVPARASDHAAQNRAEVLRPRQGIQAHLWLEFGPVQQQVVDVFVRGKPLLADELAFDERVPAVAEIEQVGEWHRPVVAVANTVAVPQHGAVRGAHIEPVERNVLDIGIEDLVARHPLEEHGGVHVALEAEGAVADALVVARGLVLPSAHRNQLLQYFVGAVLVGLWVLAIDGNGHGEQVAVDLTLVAVPVHDALPKGRPAALHITAQVPEVLQDSVALLIGHQVEAPVVGAGGDVDGASDFARDVEEVAELDMRDVVGGQLQCLPSNGLVARHEVVEGLVLDADLKVGIEGNLLVGIEGELQRRKRAQLHSLPVGPVLLRLQVLANFGQRVWRDP